MPAEEDVANQAINQEHVLVTAESHPMNAKLHSRTEPHSDVKLHNKVNAHSDFEDNVHERYVDLPNRDAHSDSNFERKNEETRAKPRLSKYVKRHHPTT